MWNNIKIKTFPSIEELCGCEMMWTNREAECIVALRHMSKYLCYYLNIFLLFTSKPKISIYQIRRARL